MSGMTFMMPSFLSPVLGFQPPFHEIWHSLELRFNMRCSRDVIFAAKAIYACRAYYIDYAYFNIYHYISIAIARRATGEQHYESGELIIAYRAQSRLALYAEGRYWFSLSPHAPRLTPQLYFGCQMVIRHLFLIIFARCAKLSYAGIAVTVRAHYLFSAYRAERWYCLMRHAISPLRLGSLMLLSAALVTTMLATMTWHWCRSIRIWRVSSFLFAQDESWLLRISLRSLLIIMMRHWDCIHYDEADWDRWFRWLLATMFIGIWWHVSADKYCMADEYYAATAQYDTHDDTSTIAARSYFDATSHGHAISKMRPRFMPPVFMSE